MPNQELTFKPDQKELKDIPKKSEVESVGFSDEDFAKLVELSIADVDERTRDVKDFSTRIDSIRQSYGLDQKEIDEAEIQIGIREQLAEIERQIDQASAEAKQEISAIQSRESEGQSATSLEPLSAIEEQTVPETETSVKVDLKSEALKMLKQNLSEVDDSNKSVLIAEINSKTELESGASALNLVTTTEKSVIIVDETGKLKSIEINSENASTVLNEIKKIDENIKGESSELRKEILKRSDGKISTHEAYTFADVSTFTKIELKTYLDNPANWIPERRKLHEDIIALELDKAEKLSKRLGDQEPTIYALRGNTAAGKTTRLRTDSVFNKAIDEKGQPSGAINPDIYKEELKEEEVVFGHQNISHSQAHIESSMLARNIRSKINESQSSMIIDQRLNESKDVDELIGIAEKTEKKLKFLDVESPFEVSLIRVLDRKIGGADPLPPFNVVAEGYAGVRRNRAELIKEVKSNPDITDYVLYVSNEKGESIKCAEKKEGEFSIVEGLDIIYQKAISEDIEAEIEILRNTVIDETYIGKIRESLHLSVNQEKSLQRYLGKTFDQALQEHSEKLNEPQPSKEDYLVTAKRNLELTSRTASGTVDTSASVDKASQMDETLNAETAAERAQSNFQKAIEIAYENQNIHFKTAKEAREFVENIATVINNGITKEGVLIREGADSTKLPYTKVAELGEKMDQFYEEFFLRLNDPKEDPVALSAWAEYHIDLKDHFFADGCGKTAKAVSSWIIMRAGRELPDYTAHGTIPPEKARNVYYENAPRRDEPGLTSEDEKTSLDRWTKYYKKLC